MIYYFLLWYEYYDVICITGWYEIFTDQEFYKSLMFFCHQPMRLIFHNILQPSSSIFSN